MKVITGKVRMNYTNLFTPKAVDLEEGKYSLSIQGFPGLRPEALPDPGEQPEDPQRFLRHAGSGRKVR